MKPLKSETSEKYEKKGIFLKKVEHKKGIFEILSTQFRKEKYVSETSKIWMKRLEIFEKNRNLWKNGYIFWIPEICSIQQYVTGKLS